MELKLGVVGLASHAEDVQKEFHDMIGGDEPMGWDTQLPDEPVINVGYTVAHLWHKGSVGETAEGDSFPSGTWVSAPTSPVSDSACTARSAGIWWMPWARPHSARG